MSEQDEVLVRKIKREKKAREEAEALLEDRTKEIYNLYRGLEVQIQMRTGELKGARDEAVKANQAKSQFLANMSHEIRTPLHGILGLLELLSKTELSESQREYVSTIIYSGKMLLSIINEILDFSRIEAGKIDFEFKDFNLLASLEGLMDVVASNAFKKNLDFVLRIKPDVPEWIHGDETKLRQVLVNLLGNAIKFTHEGEVSLEVAMTSSFPIPGAPAQHRIRFSVRDTGIGIPADRIEEVLKPFSQVDITDSRKYGGTGLGLTISDQIVKKLGGTLAIQSQEAVGSEFSFDLPLSECLEKNHFDELFSHRLTLHKMDIVFASDAVAEIVMEVLQIWQCQARRIASFSDWAANVKAREFQQILIVDARTVLHLEKDSEEYKRFLEFGRDLRGQILLLAKPQEKNHAEKLLKSLGAMGLHHVFTMPLHRTALLRVLLQDDQSEETQRDEIVQQQKTEKGIRRFLLVEDNEINRLVAVTMLNSMGIEVVIAENGQEAVDRVNKGEAFEMILMDCQMPVMDGYEATIAIRKWEQSRGVHTPIIAMTANAFRKTKEKCFDSGMDGFVTKPFTQDDLEAAIKRQAGQRSKAS